MSRRHIILISSTVAVLAIAVGAYAYFITTGTGSGTDAAGSNSGSITLAATGFVGILPGDGGKTVTFTGSNSNTTTSLRVSTISFVSVTSSVVPCQAVLTANPGQFTMATVTSNTTVPKGAVVTPLTGTGTLVWADSNTVDQTPCAGALLTLNVSSVSP
jgi:hypothetical protein